ncbi:MAG: maltose ABC transporter substrate-binding protein [Actinomycetia bacterium]|nr:maltose ABC transporter substrate-binding protein [Actinomycetes bacterium]
MNLHGVAALVVSAALALAGCGSSSTAPGASTSASQAPAAGQITVWVDANRQPVLKDVADQFTKETGVAVDLQVKDFSTIRDDAITQIPTGKGPDILIGAHDWTGKLVQNGVVAPVELGSKASQFQSVSVQAMTYEGKVYGVPYSLENLGLLRNTALAPTAPTSWADLVTTGKAAVSSGKAKYPVLLELDPMKADPYHLYPLQASYGAPVFTSKPDGSLDATTIAMGNEGGKQFAAALAQWGKDGVLNLSISKDIAKEQFIAGTSPYLVTGPWNLADIKKAGIQYAIDPIPAAGPQPATPFVGVQGFFLSAKSQNAVAANTFLLNYIGSEKVQTALYQAGNRAPALTSAFNAAQSDKDVAAFGAIGATGVPMPNVPAMDQVWTDWGTTEAQLIGGKAADPAAAWTQMVASIQAKIK